MYGQRVADSGEETPDRAEHAPWEPLKIHAGWRFAGSVVGLALLGVASVATLMTENGVGAAALAGIGAFMVLVAALGQLPSKLTWGDKSAEWWRAQQVRQKEESGADAEQVADVAASVASTPLEMQLASTLRRVQGQSDLTERLILSVLADAVTSAGGTFHEVAGPDLGWDARISAEPDSPLAHSVAVVAQLNSTMTLAGIRQLAAQMKPAKDSGVAGLVVAGSVPPHDLQVAFDKEIWFYGAGQPRFEVFWIPVPSPNSRILVEAVVNMVKARAAQGDIEPGA